MATSNRLRILVLGYIVRGPLGGLSWHHLQYVLGLHRLGHDVYFLEDSEDYPSCYDPVADTVSEDATYGLRYTAAAFTRLGLADRWAYFDAHQQRWHGPCGSRATEIAASADLILNVSGVNPIRPWLEAVPVRAFIDTDPAFTQIRHLTSPDARARVEAHTDFLTFGESFGNERCLIPDDGLAWHPTRQPVVLDIWPVEEVPERSPLTTVMQWESYASLTYEGVEYGMKSRSFEPYYELPSRTGATLELALGGATAPRDRLEAHGWRLRDSREPTRDPWTFQDFVAASRAEFSVAKHGYVVSHSGWFSERSANYLASGRPVVVQDTNFREAWGVAPELGVIAFSSADEAVAAIADVDDRYAEHARAAREVAAAVFDSDVVLADLIENVFAS